MCVDLLVQVNAGLLGLSPQRTVMAECRPRRFTMTHCLSWHPDLPLYPPCSVFLAVMRPLPPRPTSMRAWVTPNGMFLCGDQAFASLCGAVEAELVGAGEGRVGAG